MCSPLFLPKESSHKFAVVFVNVMHFLRVGMAHDRVEWKSMRIALFEFASAIARTRSSATPGQVPRLVQRQRLNPLVVARVHVAERFPAGELLTAS